MRVLCATVCAVLLNASSFLAVTFGDMGEAMIDVRTLGATGDGQTDDTAAFLKAVEQAKAEGKHVFVPRGTYVVSKIIALDNTALAGPEAGAWPGRGSTWSWTSRSGPTIPWRAFRTSCSPPTLAA